MVHRDAESADFIPDAGAAGGIRGAEGGVSDIRKEGALIRRRRRRIGRELKPDCQKSQAHGDACM